MTTMMGVTPAELGIVRTILKDYSFLFFGSRAAGANKKSSDLDICLRGNFPIPDQKMAELRFAFQESNLPYKVDLVDWHRLSSDFQQIILRTQADVIPSGQNH